MNSLDCNNIIYSTRKSIEAARVFIANFNDKNCETIYLNYDVNALDKILNDKSLEKNNRYYCDLIVMKEDIDARINMLKSQKEVNHV